MRIKQGLLFIVFFLLFGVAYSQTSPEGYAAKWKVVDSLVNKNRLPRTALEAVNKIYSLAQQENNEPQRLRALIYRLRLEADNPEDDLLPSIKDLEKQVAVSHQPSASILRNLLAELYFNYLQRNRYKINGRTNTGPFVGTDITTWSIDQLNKKIGELFLASLNDEESLAKIITASFDPVVIRGNGPRLRPTLFDLLAQNALDYFKNADSYSGRYSNSYEMDDPAIFSDASAFATHRFKVDTSFSSCQALLLEQRLLRRKLADGQTDALVAADLDRIGFAHSIFTDDNKEELYRQALQRLAERYTASPEADQVWFLIAAQYAAGVEDGGDSTGNLKAVDICTTVLSKADSSEGWFNCNNLLHSIRQRQLNIWMENVSIPHRPMRALVKWRNFSRLYWRIARLDDPKPRWNSNLFDSISLHRLLRLPVYRSGMQSLPDTKDYMAHGVEIALPSLPPGCYLLEATNDSSWSGSKGIVSIGQFAVSDIMYMSQGDDFFVLGREDGRPLAGATVEMWEGDEDRSKHWIKKETYSTDADGHFRLSPKKDRGSRLRIPEIKIPGDQLFFLQGRIYSQDMEDTTPVRQDRKTFEKEHRQCFLFTDRAIYRPGQTVFFKAMLTTTDFDSHRPRLVSGEKSKIVLLNANDDHIDSLVLVTNDYGSCHGQFQLPVGQLNGNFSIQIDSVDGDVGFAVEEYQRPKFNVNYDKPKDSYRLGDSIRVTGYAMAYAGNAIDGGKVVWQVKRNAFFPHPWAFWRTGYPNTSEQEIAHGVARTDATGKFYLVFPALPDRHVARNTDPEFHYTISADVTDINGETRSGSTVIVVGYTSLNLSVDVPADNWSTAGSGHTVIVRTSNLSGEPIAADVHLAVYRLKAPQRLIRDRLWQDPDRWVMTEKEWLDSFPNDEYREETKKENWEKGMKIWDTVVAVSEVNVKTVVPARTAGPGWYLIEATSSDKNGQEAKDLAYVEVFDGKTGRPGNPQYNWSLGNGQTVQPGQTATTESGSSSDVYVIRTVQRVGEDKGPSFSHFTMKDEKRGTSWPISEKDRGGFQVVDAWVRDNRLYIHPSTVNVPWTNKDLDIHYSSYRNKMEPGSPEKWQLTISGHRGEKLAAEVLTGMYDVSLDQFDEQHWRVPDLYPSLGNGSEWDSRSNFGSDMSLFRLFNGYRPVRHLTYDDRLMQVWDAGDVTQISIRGRRMLAPLMAQQDALRSGTWKDFGAGDTKISFTPPRVNEMEKADTTRVVNYMDPSLKGEASERIFPAPPPPVVQARKDFRETAFFFPDLRTDSAGNVSFSFTMPEAVTSWKWMTLAHTRDLAFGYDEKTVITQKELMVQPNAPRFLREGDRMGLPVKVVNLTDSELTGQMSLELTDPTTGETADGWFTNRQANQYFTVGARQSAVVSFPIDIPYQYNRPMTYSVVATAGKYSDAEEATLPVVSNRLLVTESLPLNMPGDGTRHFTFDKLLKSGSSETLNHHALTVEFTANPAWYAVQSLPYLMEYPHECSEQVFQRVYANTLASHIVGASPRLQQVFDRWRNADTAQLLSNLQKNPELKSVLLEETPWVMEGKSETQQKKNIALLFDMHRMSRELRAALERLVELQSADGGFPWWSGGPDNRHITQVILTGIGHLLRLNAVDREQSGLLDTIVSAALPYLDAKIKKDYERERAAAARYAKASGKTRPADNTIGPPEVHYLYMRSLFPNRGLPGSAFAAVNYYRKKAQQDWVKCGPYLQGMIALALYRTGDVQTAKNIIASLKQNAIRDPERGMYWKGMEGGYYWWQAPVETQSLLIEAFHEISHDAAIDSDLKTWLLKQKQTHSWPTTTATADACYALLVGSGDWVKAERSVDMRLGDKTIDWPAGSGDAGVGYNKKVFDGAFVNPSMGNITVTMTANGGVGGRVNGGVGGHGNGGAGGRVVGTAGGVGSPAWGAVYWQYFDMLDRITPPGGGKPALSVTKKLFIRRDTDHGSLLEPLEDNGELKPGDRVVARIVLRADRDMEYVHMKDMRAACLEPTNVLSQYKWQDGLGYYESTKDASTDFFFDAVPRGTYVFEYDMLAGQSGNFSNGVTTIECLYAPEFTYHTEGIRINVETGN